VIDAAAVPSYTLSPAVNDPVTERFVIEAVAVPTVPSA
jgi:hypothetical protein